MPCPENIDTAVYQVDRTGIFPGRDCAAHRVGRSGMAVLFLAVAPLEFVDLTGRIKNLLLTCIERVAGRANFDIEVFADS